MKNTTLGGYWKGSTTRYNYGSGVDKPRKLEDGNQDHPPLEEAMRSVVLYEIDIYISRRKNAVAQCIPN